MRVRFSLSTVAAMLAVTNEIHVLRDPTRGGVASSLNEIAKASQVGIVLDERKLPVPTAVRSACELLGLDPLYVANEGKLVAVVAAADAPKALKILRAHPLGRHAADIGCVAESQPPLVEMITRAGGRRIVQRPYGEDLPRIC